ncbi:uncharacterized protein LOC117181490 [Belonocnema kinseyi]|uniref:uncharacterized protein LOC117181490 n=1 Tax=Belonocnema kinseyi TaxID=2817044 RepID=UPI00143DF8F9|nr:uncharacterized protein LOC117181490 [Belonocnema kinseyi]
MPKKMLLLLNSNNGRFEEKKLAEQARTLEKLENSQIGTKCSVTLSKSEEELFGRLGKTDANVYSDLIHEIRAQKLHLDNILNCWSEFAETVTEFSSVETDIRNQSYLESEDRDHAIREDRRMKEKTLHKERLIDRAALQLALKRIMGIMGVPEATEIQKTSSLSKKGNTVSRINEPRIKDSSEFTMYSRGVPTYVNSTLGKNEIMSASNCKECSLERLASISSDSRETELWKGKEDSNLEAEKKTQPPNGCECNSRFPSNLFRDSISVQIENTRDTDLRKASWWQRSKNKIRKNKAGLFSKKTAGDAYGNAIFK